MFFKNYEGQNLKKNIIFSKVKEGFKIFGGAMGPRKHHIAPFMDSALVGSILNESSLKKIYIYKFVSNSYV